MRFALRVPSLHLGRLAWATSLAALLAGCGSQEPEGPTAPFVQAVPLARTSLPVGSAPGFPDLTGPGRVYSFVSEDASGWDYAGGGPLTSRYVLYDDGTFALQYAEIDFHPYGTYTELDGLIELTWDRRRFWQSWKPWEATATLAGETLKVDYPVHMWLVGFLDAVYVRTE